MVDGARKFGRTFSRSLIAAFAVVAALSAASDVRAQEPGNCLSGLERLMREFQSRYYEIAKTNPNLEKNVVDWPPCCPTEKAPAFPPDGYYDNALKGDPALSVELVKQLQNLLCEFNSGGWGNSPMPITGWFSRTNPVYNDAQGPVPTYNPTLPNEERWYPTSAHPNACVDPNGNPIVVTQDNYCSVFQTFEAGLQKLQVIRLPADRSKPGSDGCTHIAPGQCGGSAYWDLACNSTAWTLNGVNCWTNSEIKCNYDTTSSGAQGKAMSHLNCIWGAFFQQPCTGTGGYPQFWEEVDAEMGLTQLGNGEYCVGWEAFSGNESSPAHDARYWGTALRLSSTNTYRITYGDIDGKRSAFFRPEYPAGRGNVDSPYRRGDVLGLPVPLCTINPPTIPGIPTVVPDWIRNPSAASNLTFQHFSTDAGFGASGNCSSGGGGGCMWLGDSASGNGADSCSPATGAFSDWGPGARGWAFPPDGVAGLIENDFNSDAERDRDCGSTCASCSEAGNPRAMLGSVDYSWPLGRSPENDRSAGYLLLRVKTVPDRYDAGPGGVHYPENVISPNRLIRNFQDATIQLDTNHPPIKVFDEYDAQNQPTVDHGVLSAFTISTGTSVQLTNYPYAQLVVEPDTNFASGPSLLYRTTVTSYARQTNAATGQIGALVKTATTTLEQSFEWVLVSGQYRKDHYIRIHNVPESGFGTEKRWEYKLAGSVWSMKEQANSAYTTALRSQEENVGPESNGQRTIVRSIKDSSGTVVDQESIIEKRSPKGGWVTLEQWRGTDPHTVRTYNSAGNLVREITPSGHWTDYVYHTTLTNLLLRTVSQFQDNAPGTSEASNVVVEGLNIPNVEVNGDQTPDIVRTQVTKVLGVPVSRTVDVWLDSLGVQHYAIQCANSDYSNLQTDALADAARLLSSGVWMTAADRTTMTLQDNHAIPSNYWRNHTIYSQSSDGSASYFGYPSFDPWTYIETSETRRGRYDPSAIYGVAWEGQMLTHTETRRDIGITARQDRLEFPSGGPFVHVDGMKVTEIDAHGKATRTVYWSAGAEPSPGADFEVRQYDCCGLQQETDRYGVTTKYTYDEFKRVKTVERQVGQNATDYLKTESVYDALGRVIEEKRYPTGANPVAQTVRANHYDVNGRMDWSLDALGNQTSYSVTYLSSGSGVPAGVLSRITLPVPAANQTAPYFDQTEYPDGQVKSAGGTGQIAKSFSYGVAAATGGQPPLRYVTEHLGNTVPASCTQWTKTWTNPLRQLVKTEFPLTASTTASSVALYNSFGEAYSQIDPDGVHELSFSGRGSADAIARLGTLPTGLDAEFKGQWSLTVQDVDQDNTVDWMTDRITLSRSYLFQIPNTSDWRRRSETLLWKTGDGTSSGDLLLINQSDTTFDGTESWVTSFGQSSHSITAIEKDSNSNPTGAVTTTSADPTGATAISVQRFGREESALRRHPPTTGNPAGAFAGKTVQEYDTLNRLVATRFVRNEAGTSEDVTEFSYNALDQLETQTDPSPTGGTAGRHVKGYLYDNLGQRIRTLYPNSKQVDYTFNDRGQVVTVRGFGANPVDYGYDALGRRTSLTTYQAANASSGAATTTWEFDAYTGRLKNKKYQGHTSPDLAYTYSNAGRTATRVNARAITTYYFYNTLGELNKTSYYDSTPPVLITARDRLGRTTEMADAAGKHAFAYRDDGGVLSETITSDLGITGAPHYSMLAGVTLTNTFGPIAGPDGNYPYGEMRTALSITRNSSALNDVGFSYDADAHMSQVTKSGGRVEYAYDPITSQETTRTDKVNFSGPWTGRIQNARTFDRLGRLQQTKWESVPGSGQTAVGLSQLNHGYDIHGRRTTMSTVAPGKDDWTYGYDDLNQLTSASSVFTGTTQEVLGNQFTYAFDAIGNRTGSTRGDSIFGIYSTSYTTNLLNRYTTRTSPHRYDVAGYSSAPSVLVNNVPASRFTSGGNVLYDGFFYRKLSDTATNSEQKTVTIQDVPGSSTSYTVYLPVTGQGLGYDADGNLTSDGLWDYTYDAENRLSTMQIHIWNNNFGIAELLQIGFLYDGMGRRIYKQVYHADGTVLQTSEQKIVWEASYQHRYIYDIGSWNLSTVLAFDQEGQYSGPIKSFAWGPDLSGTEQGAGGIGGLAIYVDDLNDGGGGSGVIGPMFPVYDGNGNILRLYDGTADSAGVPAKKAEYKYGPFGEDEGRTGPQADRFPFRWSTKFIDNESGLAYYGYRYYSPVIGKWLGNDPLEEGDGPSLNAFVKNNPVSCVDRLGLWTVTRDGGEKADAVSEAGDTITKLASEIGLEVAEYSKWLSQPGTGLNFVPTKAPTGQASPAKPLPDQDRELCPGQKFQIPNEIVAHWGGWEGIPGMGKAFVNYDRDLDTFRQRGFRVEAIESLRAATFQSILTNHTNRKVMHGLFIWGHGRYDSQDKYVAYQTNDDKGEDPAYISYFRDWKMAYKPGIGIIFTCGGNALRGHFSSGPGNIFWGKTGVLIPSQQPSVASLISPGAQRTKIPPKPKPDAGNPPEPP